MVILGGDSSVVTGIVCCSVGVRGNMAAELAAGTATGIVVGTVA